MKRLIKEIVGSGTFSLIDHSISHNQFLYRGKSSSGLNRDILISGCEYLSISVHLEDFRICLSDSAEKEKVLKMCGCRDLDKRVFIIRESRGFKHYLVADRILTQENDFNGVETSIPIKREKTMTTNDIKKLSDIIENECDNNGIHFVIDKYIQTGEWEILE